MMRPSFEFDFDREGLALLERGAQFGIVAGGIERKRAGCNARVEQVANSAAAPNPARVDPVHGAIALVPDHQPVLRIEHAQALIHVVDARRRPAAFVR